MSTPARAVRTTQRRWLVPALVAAALVLAGWWFFFHHRGADTAAGYRTEPVERGEIRTAISATGTLSATATVDVGTQVSGTLKTVEVDFNDHVTAGQVIARIDPSTLQARVDQAAATLASAQAGLGEAQAAAKNAEADYARKADLAGRQLIARTDADAALAARDEARARIASAQAQVRQQQAALSSARLDIDKSVIRSPVDGVVLERAVEPGQTVAASLQTPYCGANSGFEAAQWLEEPESVASLAMIALRHSDSASAFGLLVLGSPDPTRYTADMGTEFLMRIGEIASAALTRLVDPADA